VTTVTREIGSALIGILGEIEQAGRPDVSKHTVVDDIVYELKGSRCHIEIVVNQKRWLGMKFVLLDENGRPSLSYDIDTDLYDLKQPGNRDFALDIEDEIVEFLQTLRAGKIRVGELDGRPAMIVPKGTEFCLIKKGRVLTGTSFHKDVGSLVSKGRFDSLRC